MSANKKLKNIAGGIAHHCLSRNNDIRGWCGVGIIYDIARSRSDHKVHVEVESLHQLTSDLGLFASQLQAWFQGRSYDVKWCKTSIHFEFFDEVLTSANHHKAICRCTVKLTDGDGRVGEASASVECYPHSEVSTSRSARWPQQQLTQQVAAPDG